VSLSTGRSKLIDSSKTLAARWEATRDAWGDAAGQEFEEGHVTPIAPHVQAAVRAVDRLAAVLAQMRQECG
jgi:hypothetical protein